MRDICRFWLPALLLGLSGAARGDDAYKIDSGPFPVIAADDVMLTIPDSARQLPLQISYPGGSERHAVVVLSHGGGCPAGGYTALADHWASHGYIVIQPVHQDSRSLGFSFADMKSAQIIAIVRSRRLDMQHILDSFAAIERQVPALAGRLDPARLTAAGHSMGGATAMAVTGLALQNTLTGSIDRVEEDRFDALLLLGDPGNRAFMPEAPWRAIAVPALIVTGTDDHGQAIDESRMKFAFVDGLEMAATPNYYLFIEGMNHYLGGLLCRADVPGPADYEAMSITRGISTAFLDAHMNGDTRARALLRSNRLPALTTGRAALTLR